MQQYKRHKLKDIHFFKQKKQDTLDEIEKCKQKLQELNNSLTYYNKTIVELETKQNEVKRL